MNSDISMPTPVPSNNSNNNNNQQQQPQTQQQQQQQQQQQHQYKHQHHQKKSSSSTRGGGGGSNRHSSKSRQSYHSSVSSQHNNSNNNNNNNNNNGNNSKYNKQSSVQRDFSRATKWDIVYLTSSPLVFGSDPYKPLDQLDISGERDAFFNTLKASKQKLRVIHKTGMIYIHLIKCDYA